MRNVYIIIVLNLVLTAAPTVYLCLKGIKFYSITAGDEVAVGYQRFADEVASGEVTFGEIAKRLEKISKGERQIALGASQLKRALLYWLIAITAITYLQWLFLRQLLKTHKRHMEKSQ